MTDPLPPVAQDGRWTVDEGLAWVDPNGRRWTLDPDDLAQIWTAAPDPTVAAACASLVALADRVCDLEQDNEGLSRHTAFMERYRMRATRLGGEAEALLDAVKDRLDQETGDDATPDSFHGRTAAGWAIIRVSASTNPSTGTARRPAHVYDGNDPVFQGHSAEKAAELVELLNAGDQRDAALRVIRRYADGWHPVWTTVTDGTKAEWWRAVWDADDEIEPIPGDERAVIEAARALGGHPSGDSE